MAPRSRSTASFIPPGQGGLGDQAQDQVGCEHVIRHGEQERLRLGGGLCRQRARTVPELPVGSSDELHRDAATASHRLEVCPHTIGLIAQRDDDLLDRGRRQQATNHALGQRDAEHVN